MRASLKTRKSQMLNAEVEAFLAKGGKIKVVSDTALRTRRRIKLKEELGEDLYNNDFSYIFENFPKKDICEN